MEILIADDAEETLIYLKKFLSPAGHFIRTASNGSQALQLIKETTINFLITDWEMPVMNGIELIQEIRAMPLDRYVYIILVTAKNDKRELALALDSGADDYIVKPFNNHELRARIRAGERILSLQRDLSDRNRHLELSLDQLSRANKVMQADLDAAESLQAEMLPPEHFAIDNYSVHRMFHPARHLAGDTLNYFPLDKETLAFYLLDVSGHGIPSAMLSFLLSATLIPGPAGLASRIDASEEVFYSPGDLLSKLNAKFQRSIETLMYFTMVYGTVHLPTGEVRLASAGHPYPFILSADGGHSIVTTKSTPVGMMPDTHYAERIFVLDKGDRLVLYSDGITEVSSGAELYGDRRLLSFLNNNSKLDAGTLFGKLKKELTEVKGNDNFDDDVSMLIIERGN